MNTWKPRNFGGKITKGSKKKKISILVEQFFKTMSRNIPLDDSIYKNGGFNLQ